MSLDAYLHLFTDQRYAGILKERLKKDTHTHKDGKIEKDNKCLPYSQQINRTRVWDDINN